MRLRRRLPVLLAAMLVFMLSVGGLLASYLAAHLRESRDMIAQDVRIGQLARSVLSDMQDAENGLRGFIIAGQEQDLAPYRAATVSLPLHLRSLHSLAERELGLIGRVSRLETLVGQGLAIMAEALPPQARSGRWATQGERERLAMEAIRQAVGDLVAEQETRIAEQIADAQAAEELVFSAAVVGVIVSVLVVFGGGLLLFRRNRQLRLAEADLARQTALLQATLDNGQDGIGAFDAAGALVAFNHRFFTLLDLPLKLATAGTPILSLAQAEEGRPRPVLAAMRGRPAGQAFLLSLDGRELEVFRNPMPDGGFVLTCVDVTRRAQAEAAMQHGQKMEAVGHLTGGMAHDFNNLLQVITGNLELLARTVPREGRAALHLANALGGAERGARLTAQLLAFARRQPLDPRVFNLGRRVQDMTDLLRRILGEQIEVRATVAAGLWNTLADPVQVENALLNLAINGRDAMPDGGHLSIELANAFLDEDYAAAYCDVVPGQYVMLAVSDTGSGMPPDVAERAFEPFFTTKPEGLGTGLGLSQVYGFVRQSGGHVRLQSVPGQGTTVRLYLPRSHRPADAAEPAAPGQVEGGHETILVVEDDAPVREAVVGMLTDLGYRVLKAGDALQALSILEDEPRIDLLFTDFGMPGPLKTRDLARQARVMIPDLKVLYTSGYAADEVMHDGRLDAGLLLSKPYRREELAQRIRRVLGVAPACPTVRPNFSALLPEPSPILAQARHGWPEGTAVLVVEDDQLIRLSLEQMLEELGFRVDTVETAEAALPRMERGQIPSILITDISLPGMSGLSLAQQLRQDLPGLAVLVATGFAGDAVLPPALEGQVGLLTKPFGMAQLGVALGELHHQLT